MPWPCLRQSHETLARTEVLQQMGRVMTLSSFLHLGATLSQLLQLDVMAGVSLRLLFLLITESRSVKFRSFFRFFYARLPDLRHIAARQRLKHRVHAM
ncbi:hypothetical protein Msub_10319 [Marinobacter subterrani]|uniref:Uncharacterized protein n=1 Tax=Marinobacter subterrani TaxID=1658765 RepID=A0A0J7J8C2_9GAMM|nr:hypothetical protein Msub_10319 [Marinobacter subterrani]